MAFHYIQCHSKFLWRPAPLVSNADNKFNYEGWNFNSGNYLFTTDTK